MPNREEGLTKPKKHLIDVMNKMLMQVSLEDITIKVLVQEAGITRSTFYTHYQDKYALFEDVINNCFQEIYNGLSFPLAKKIDEVESMFRSTFSQILTAIYHKHHIFNQTTMKERQQVLLKSLTVIKPIHIEQLKQLGFKDEDEREYRTAFYLNGLIFTYDNWINQNYDVSIEDLSEYLTNYSIFFLTPPTK